MTVIGTAVFYRNFCSIRRLRIDRQCVIARAELRNKLPVGIKQGNTLYMLCFTNKLMQCGSNI